MSPISDVSGCINEGESSSSKNNQQLSQSPPREKEEVILSEVWKTAVDPTTSQTYYYNIKTRETQWRMPKELASEEEQKIMEEKDQQTLAFFSAMEANILQSISKGMKIPQKRPSALDNAMMNKIKNTLRPTFVRTISTLDSNVLKELLEEVPSCRVSSSLSSSLSSSFSDLSSKAPHPHKDELASKARRKSAADAHFPVNNGERTPEIDHSLYPLKENDSKNWDSKLGETSFGTMQDINGNPSIDLLDIEDNSTSGDGEKFGENSMQFFYNEESNRNFSVSEDESNALNKLAKITTQMACIGVNSLSYSNHKSSIHKKKQYPKRRDEAYDTDEKDGIQDNNNSYRLGGEVSLNLESSKKKIESFNGEKAFQFGYDEQSMDLNCLIESSLGLSSHGLSSHLEMEKSVIDFNFNDESDALMFSEHSDESDMAMGKDYDGQTPAKFHLNLNQAFSRSRSIKDGRKVTKNESEKSIDFDLVREKSMKVDFGGEKSMNFDLGGEKSMTFNLGGDKSMNFNLDGDKSMNFNLDRSKSMFSNHDEASRSMKFDFDCHDETEDIQLGHGKNLAQHKLNDLDYQDSAIESSSRKLNQKTQQKMRRLPPKNDTLLLKEDSLPSPKHLSRSTTDPLHRISNKSRMLRKSWSCRALKCAIDDMTFHDITEGGEDSEEFEGGEVCEGCKADNDSSDKTADDIQTKRPSGTRPRHRNSCSTLYIGTTMSKPDEDATFRVVCAVYRVHVIQSESYEEMHEDMYKYRVFNDLTSYQTPMKKEEYHPSMDHDPNLPLPTLLEISNFYREVFRQAQMEIDCIIMSLIYAERLMKITGGALRPRKCNWRSILFSCMVLASKVWDDYSFLNSEFSQNFLLGIRFPLKRINQLEMAVLSALHYEVKVRASEYAKYYFLLRSCLIKSGLTGEHNFSPLDILGARKLQNVSSQYQKRENEARKKGTKVDDSLYDRSFSQPFGDLHDSKAKVTLEHVVTMGR